MKYRRLGIGPLEVSELGFGTWLTVAGGVERQQAIRCVHAALDYGVTLFDTANQYGAGAAERLLGEALRAYPRDKYLVATKLYFTVGNEPDHGLSAAQIEKQLNRSLERLGVEFIDLYQCHRYDKETPLEETLTALDRAVKAGKVRTIGFSEWTAEQIDATAALAGGWAGSFIFQSAAVLDALAQTGIKCLRGLHPARDRQLGVLAARTWRADWKVCSGPAPTSGKPRGQRSDEHVYGVGGAAFPIKLSAGSSGTTKADCGGSWIDNGADGAGVGAAENGGGVGNYRGVAA